MHPHCIPNSLYFSSQMTHSFILFDLVVSQNPIPHTRSHQSPPLLHCFPGLCLWKPPNSDPCASVRPTDPRSLSPSGYSRSQKAQVPLLSTPQPPTTTPSPVPSLKPALCTSMPPSYPPPTPPPRTISLPSRRPRSCRVPPVPGSASRTLQGLRRGKELLRLLLLLF